ncbi:MAG: CoA-binding protein [Woeseia sp.]
MSKAENHFNDDSIIRILKSTRTIAMVGASPSTDRPSHGVMHYLQRAGYRVIPVNPTVEGTTILGEAVVPSLADIDEAFEMVNVFRRSDALPELVDELEPMIDARAIRCLWLQLGVRHAAAASKAQAAGLEVVMDRCLKVEHARLVGF